MPSQRPLKILLTSYLFPPHVGGVETMVDGLACYFAARDHRVDVLTSARKDDGRRRDFNVIRGARPRAVWAAIKNADIVVLNQVGLKFSWPLFFLRRTTFVVHHNSLPPLTGRRAIFSWLKQRLARGSHNIAVSRFIAETLPVAATVIFSSFRSDIFRDMGLERTADLGFCGRIVESKGLAVLIAAMELLADRGVRPSLEIVGEGAQWPELEARIKAASLGAQVTYHGPLSPEGVRAVMNRVKVMVVPSVYPEPCGLVAPEAMACGCALVASRVGGLPEVVGDAGLLVPPNDPEALAAACRVLLEQPGERKKRLAAAKGQMERCALPRVAEQYLALFHKAVAN
jgi:glycosyltransferase involved in cell wall biosynthesis|tara:strand:+ start:2223 stop:3251 length:1029 start_codon:yes stop_codon:yes gene_type:complete